MFGEGETFIYTCLPDQIIKEVESFIFKKLHYENVF